MKIKSYLIITLVCSLLIISCVVFGVIFSLLDGVKYSSLIELLGAIIQSLCAIIVLLYAIYHDDLKEEKNHWPKLMIDHICYMGKTKPDTNSVLLCDGEAIQTTFECKVRIYNNCNIHNLCIKTNRYGGTSYSINDINKFVIAINSDRKRRYFYLRFEDDYGNKYLQKFYYFITGSETDKVINFICKHIKQCILKHIKGY